MNNIKKSRQHGETRARGAGATSGGYWGEARRGAIKMFRILI